MKGNKDILELLVKSGGDINACDFKGRTPIIYAIMQNKSEAAFKCIELGADTTLKDNEGHLPIDYATTNGLKELVNFLSAGEKDNFGNTLLHQACYNNQSEVVKTLLKSSSSEINNMNDSGETPLILAVKNENQYIVELLIENKADVNLAANNGEYPLPL